MRLYLVFSLCLLAIIDIYAQAQPLQDYLKPVKYRNIGPFRGGRSVCASGVDGDPLTYYMGTTGGGLWKTTDAGQRWRNISDGYFKTGSVGAVAVSTTNTNVIYVGMGEHAPRGVMTSHGDGVYKSTDAGKTWTHLGLEKTQHISRIIIHPHNDDVVFVAAQGALHGNNTERGIYKSTDGGKTWKKVLYINDMTGCSELSINLQNPLEMYAGMWEHQRKPWTVISGGKGSGLYKSKDGGETWDKLENGLPKTMGKTAIAVAQSNTDIVYALVEADWEEEKGGLYKSTNAGKSWTQITKDHALIQRSWYYTEVFVDPQNENLVYILNAGAHKSIDGGKKWSRIWGTHGDYHDLWINPANANNLCIANDGGAAISFDQGKTWSRQDNMPTAQFYRVNVDNLFPYNIYGGQQDNSSIRIASRELGSSTISQKSWRSSAGGESAFLAFDKDDPRYVMGGSYLGTIELKDMHTGASTRVMSAPIQYLGMEARDMKYLYNWNAPIVYSQHEKGTWYHAAQYVLRSRDNGVTWEEVSKDLTRNQDDKQGNGGIPITNEAVGAENYGTISYMIESPHDKGVFWTGSDDGLVHLTRDNCGSWVNVTPKGLAECLINAIEVSPHDPATAYIATTRYKFNDKTPAVYKTTNYGKTWQNISSNIPNGAYTRVIREDEKRKDMLYCGTELGMYISYNGGNSWQPLQLNLPVTPILDLQQKHDDLIVGTSGRSFWVLDDIGLLRQQESQDALNLYTPEDTYLTNTRSALDNSSASFKGTHDFEGINPASGVVIYYHLPKDLSGKKVTMEIKDSKGRIINSFSTTKDKSFKSYPGGPPSPSYITNKEGLNRFVWNMRHRTMPGIPTAYIEASYRGHRVAPGTYTISLTSGDKTMTQECTILANPFYPTDINYEEYDTFMSEVEEKLIAMHTMVNKLSKKRARLEAVLAELDTTDNAELVSEAKDLIAESKSWDEEMVQRRSKAYDDVENFPNKFTAQYLAMINQSESEIPRINNGSRQRRTELDAEWISLQQVGRDLLDNAYPTLSKKLWEAGIGALGK